MKLYTRDDLAQAYATAGIGPGDVVYLLSRLFSLGMLKGAKSQDDFLARHLAALRDAAGPDGTIVVPAFTPQVGRFGLPYVHEETVSSSGMLGEFVRKQPGAVRSLHPVFSLAGIGARASEILDDVSPVCFGADSAFDRLRRANAKCVCIGFPFHSGHIVSLVHHIETIFGVPYMYNKLVRAPVSKHGRAVETSFVINVRYLHIDYRYDPRRFVDALAEGGLIRQAAIGDSHVYGVEAEPMVQAGLRLLRRDLHAFLAVHPGYPEGQAPNEGPPFPPEAAEGVNVEAMEWYL